MKAALSSGEPREEAHVVVEELAHVGDTVRAHRVPLDAHAEGEPRHLLGVVAYGAEHVRMDHAAAEQLDPSTAFARAAARALAVRTGDVQFGGRLGEREIR